MSVRASLFQALLAESGDEFCLDLSEVEHCDSAGLALLIEASKLCKQRKKIFESDRSFSRTQSLAEFCGVKSILVS